MPAPAVIPAPRAYINVVAVKKLVVGCKGAGWGGPWSEVFANDQCAFSIWPVLFNLCGNDRRRKPSSLMAEAPSECHAPSGAPTDVTVSNSECSKHPACRENAKAWNNKGSTAVASFCWFSSHRVVTSCPIVSALFLRGCVAEFGYIRDQ